jgi:UDPglucose--hexose-1-phosphate uridylyltransferase
VPFAAVGPLELRIVPKRHQPSLSHAGDGELAALGPVLQRAIGRLEALLGQPAYNYVFECGDPPMVEAASFHWRLRLLPSLVTPGGFELGSGLAVNPSLPERDAAALQAAEASRDHPGEQR